MSLIVHTARIGYAGRDQLDVTRKSATGHALTFAPSWHLLGPILAARRRHEPIAELWPAYVRGYTAEMRASYRGNVAAWAWLLARTEVTLLCYCTDAVHCHRRLLAEILTQCGAVDRGERQGVVPSL